jgi:hypothetical protein
MGGTGNGAGVVIYAIVGVLVSALVWFGVMAPWGFLFCILAIVSLTGALMAFVGAVVWAFGL